MKKLSFSSLFGLAIVACLVGANTTFSMEEEKGSSEGHDKIEEPADKERAKPTLMAKTKQSLQSFKNTSKKFFNKTFLASAAASVAAFPYFKYVKQLPTSTSLGCAATAFGVTYLGSKLFSSQPIKNVINRSKRRVKNSITTRNFGIATSAVTLATMLATKNPLQKSFGYSVGTGLTAYLGTSAVGRTVSWVKSYFLNHSEKPAPVNKTSKTNTLENVNNTSKVDPLEDAIDNN